MLTLPLIVWSACYFAVGIGFEAHLIRSYGNVGTDEFVLGLRKYDPAALVVGFLFALFWPFLFILAHFRPYR